MNSFFLQKLHNARIGYVPYSRSLDRPGDCRRFPFYASKRGIKFEIADPEKEYDIVILSECADISIWSRYPKGKLVYDLIDSYLAIPRTDLKGWLRGSLKFLSGQSRFLQINHWKAIESMCIRADAVVCSTEEQRKIILRFCPNVHIILDAHMNLTRTVKTHYHAGESFRLVWEGLPHTMRSLNLIRSVLNRLNGKYPIEIHIITDRKYFRWLGKYGKTDALNVAQKIFPNVSFHEWQESSVADIICSCDLAIIPLSLTDPFAQGKPENKLLLFWRLGMPVITSATPAYKRAMSAAGINLVAKDQDEWLSMIEKLLIDEKVRREAATAGMIYVSREFSESTILSRWDILFESLY